MANNINAYGRNLEDATTGFIASARRNSVYTLSKCFHCGLPNLEGMRYSTVIAGQAEAMCCPGCQAVAQAIVENGLADYYKFRTEPAAKGDELLDSTLEKLSIYDQPAIQEEFVFDSGSQKQIQLTVEGITCAACGWLIEKQLATQQQNPLYLRMQTALGECLDCLKTQPTTVTSNQMSMDEGIELF